MRKGALETVVSLSEFEPSRSSRARDEEEEEQQRVGVDNFDHLTSQKQCQYPRRHRCWPLQGPFEPS